MNLKQTMLTLAYTADAQAELTGPKKEVNIRASKIMNCILSKVFPSGEGWDIVWGPVVYSFPTTKYSDNTMFVARSQKNPNDYSICIAGTNPNSISDWIVEDFWVGEQVEWDYGNPPAGSSTKISKGTSVGLSALQGMVPQKGMAGEGHYLREFMAAKVRETTEAVNIYVTGHSLGGALAPTFALWLSDSQDIWNPDKKAKLHAWVFAGPTPGNRYFANYLNSQFPGEQLTVVDNSLDVVPHAWGYNTMVKIPNLYLPDYRPGLALRVAVYAIAELVKKVDYTALGVGDQVQPIEGTISNESDPSKSKAKNFAKQMLYQHVNAYPEKLNLPNLLTQMSSCKDIVEEHEMQKTIVMTN